MLWVAKTLVTLAGAMATPPQPPRIDGSWRATLPGAVRTENGIQTVESTTTADLQLLRCGDAVIGSVRRATSSVSRSLRGMLYGTSLVLEGKAPARTNVNGQDYEVTLVVTYKLQVVGDSLHGTTETQLEKGSAGVALPGVEQAPLPMHAVRAPAPTGEPLVCRDPAGATPAPQPPLSLR
jgi:hypothetical protein